MFRISVAFATAIANCKFTKAAHEFRAGMHAYVLIAVRIRHDIWTEIAYL